MFERYNEKARRTIFFARYEASQYGSSVIASEHILLGLLREDRATMRPFAGSIDLGSQIRTEIDSVIKRGKPFTTSVEVPLSDESKKILNFAGEEAERLGHRHIGTEHILLGILRLQDSLAAKLLLARGAKPNVIREQIAQRAASVVATTQPARGALSTLTDLLDLLKTGPAEQVAALFHEKGQFVDSSGRRWLGARRSTEEPKSCSLPLPSEMSAFSWNAQPGAHPRRLSRPYSGNSPPLPATAANHYFA